MLDETTSTTATRSICDNEYDADMTPEVDSTHLCPSCAPSLLRPDARKFSGRR
ncbi:MAG: hypothetical protein Q8O67_31445 [Deltaproteobacteria bacterium]|nr:hypothetical protein [Deltaproteobacteria bacterium]